MHTHTHTHTHTQHGAGWVLAKTLGIAGNEMEDIEELKLDTPEHIRYVCVCVCVYVSR